MNMKDQITIVGAIRIALSLLLLVAAAIVFVAVVGGGLLSGDRDAIAITGVVGTAIAGLLTLFALPGIIGGIGLIRLKSWARYVVMVLAVFDLTNVPIGTLLGGYSIWVLMQDEAVGMFS
jgi:hypothetical protein